MSVHQKDLSELIDMISSKTSYDQLKPSLFKRNCMVSANSTRHFSINCQHLRSEFRLMAFFPSTLFRDNCVADQYIPYSVEMNGHYTKASGVEYEKIVIEGHFENNIMQQKVTIIYEPTSGTITMDNYLQHCKTEMDDDFDTLLPEEQTVKLLSGFARPAKHILDCALDIHEHIECLTVKIFRRQQKFRIVELLMGQWLQLPYTFGTFPSKPRVALMVFANACITYLLAQAYLALVLLAFGISL
jgi:hypothetical protein